MFRTKTKVSRIGTNIENITIKYFTLGYLLIYIEITPKQYAKL